VKQPSTTVKVLGIAVVVVTVLLGRYEFSSGNKVTARTEVVVKIHSTKRYGNILVTAQGFTLYRYKFDTKDHSECETFCLHVWPPFTVADGVIPEGVGLTGLGTLLRSNGEYQVTYEGMPLYHYVYDHYPGRILGNAGWWSVVKVSPSTS
jgi:predicted lipoprotein with Yx(FWY)xxD motif